MSLNKLLALLFFSGLSQYGLCQTASYHADVMTMNVNNHSNSHGGENFQQFTWKNMWQLDDDSQGQLLSSFSFWHGTDSNKLYLKGEWNRVESQDKNAELFILYSRYLSEFWDFQIGAAYQENKAEKAQDSSAVFGLHGLAPYFFETDAWIQFSNDFVAFEFENSRDILLTQKLIFQPFLNARIVVTDQRDFAQEKGLNQLQTGIQARYEITKQSMPFVQIMYQYNKGRQQLETSSHQLFYGLGIIFKF